MKEDMEHTNKRKIEHESRQAMRVRTVKSKKHYTRKKKHKKL